VSVPAVPAERSRLGAQVVVSSGIDVEGIELDAVRSLPRLPDGTVHAAILWSALDAMPPASLSEHDQLELIAAWTRLASAADGRRLEAGAAFQSRPYRGQSVMREFAADEIALRVAGSPRTVERQLNAGYVLRDRLPGTSAALRAGTIDLTKAIHVAEAAAPLDVEHAAMLERHVLDDAPGTNPASLKRRLARAVIGIDPAAAEERRRRAQSDRYVSGTPSEDGMADVHARLSGFDWVVINTAVNAAARGLKASGDQRTMDQLRADALVAPFVKALKTGTLDGLDPIELAQHRGAAALVSITVSAASLLGASDEPAELEGFGPVTAGTVREIATDARWRRILTDPVTGSVVDVGTTRYTPPEALARLVESRDSTCRFPGCGVQAVRCDLDHTVPFPQGPTSADNLGALCRRHHRLKHQVPGLELTQDGSGRFLWTMPTGHEHHVDPPATGPPDDPLLE
jgi:hypothetical protein